jgi:hypothetical protein
LFLKKNNSSSGSLVIILYLVRKSFSIGVYKVTHGIVPNWHKSMRAPLQQTDIWSVPATKHEPIHTN